VALHDQRLIGQIPVVAIEQLSPLLQLKAVVAHVVCGTTRVLSTSASDGSDKRAVRIETQIVGMANAA